MSGRLAPFAAIALGCAPLDAAPPGVPGPPSDDRAPLGAAAHHLPRSPARRGDVAATWEVVNRFSCADPTARARDGALQALTDRALDAVPFDPDAEGLFVGGGALVYDLDGDGDLDLLLPGADDTRLLLQRSDGSFEDATASLPSDRDAATGAAAADLDGDGVAEIVLTRWERPFRLWARRGDRFEDVTDAAGLGDPWEDRRTSAVAFADMDLDGDLDLFIGAYGPYAGALPPPEVQADPSLLWINDLTPGGPLRLRDASDRLPDAVQRAWVLAARWIDLDDDGAPDLYTVHDFGQRGANALSWNRVGELVLDTFSGLDVRLDGMGLDAGDLNDDGRPDLFMAGWGMNRLMISGPGGRWYDEALLRGAAPRLVIPSHGRQEIGWSSSMGDLDHDQDLDLVEGFGGVVGFEPPLDQVDAIWALHAPTGAFHPLGPEAGWSWDPPGATRGVVLVDLDGDGHLDLVRRDLRGPPTIHRQRCGAAGSIVVELRQPGPNPVAVGAEITLWTDRTQTRSVIAGGPGLLSGGPPEVHIGTADHATATLGVRWPDGATSTLRGVPTRARLRVTRR